MHDVLVVDPLSHFLQQPVMPDIVKVGSQIKVEDPRLPLSYCFRHSLDRVVCCPLGPISIRPRLEVRLEHRFEDELERTLHHSVPDRRDRQDADFPPVFRYLLLPGWEWLVGAPGQFVAQLLEQSCFGQPTFEIAPHQSCASVSEITIVNLRAAAPRASASSRVIRSPCGPRTVPSP